jgi:hypothetical protein
MASNYKSLGIEKEMSLEFSNYKESDLQRLQKSDYFDNPHITKRQENAHYCMVMVIDCQHESWWYANLIGLTFFCRVKYTNNRIVEYIGVKLTKNKEIIFRTIDAKDVLIV